MKTNIKHIFIIFTLSVWITGCSDYLDIVPDNVATIDDAFDDENSAESFLFTCYSHMPSLGEPRNNPGFYGGDASYRVNSLIRGDEPSYLVNSELALGAQETDVSYLDYWSGGRNGTNLYLGINDCNVFLENIDKLRYMDEDLRKRWIAEVKFLKAYYNFYLFRMYGPIILNDTNLPIDADISEIHKFRSPADECVTYIADLFLEASNDLPLLISDRANELGRATKGAALGMRAKVLATGASPLFNGNAEYANVIDANGTRLFSDYDANKWQLAADACKMAIDTIEFAGIQLFKFDTSDMEYLPANVTRDDVPEEIVNVLTIQQSLSERWTDEKIFVSTNGTAGRIQNHAQARTHVKFQDNDEVMGFYSPTLRIAEMFYTKNGVPIDEDLTWNYADRYGLIDYDVDNDSDTDGNGVPDNQYFVKDGETTINLHMNREVRFYGSLGFDRGIWYGNPAQYNTNGAQAGFEDHYVEARASEYSGTAIGSGVYSQTGYFPKKLVNYDNVISSDDLDYSRVTYAFPELRLADLYLLYAECANEVDDRATAYIYIDKVRERANLKGVVESWGTYSSNPSKPSTKEGFRDIVRQERLIELVFEGHRFWDLKRWKLAEYYLNIPFRGWNYLGGNPQDYYTPNVLGTPTYSFKNNLWPIETGEILSNPNLIQNGGW